MSDLYRVAEFARLAAKMASYLDVFTAGDAETASGLERMWATARWCWSHIAWPMPISNVSLLRH
jgi:hypothetical protein